MTALLRHTVFFMQLFNEKAGTEHHKMAGSQRGKDEVRANELIFDTMAGFTGAKKNTVGN